MFASKWVPAGSTFYPKTNFLPESRHLRRAPSPREKFISEKRARNARGRNRREIFWVNGRKWRKKWKKMVKKWKKLTKI